MARKSKNIVVIQWDSASIAALWIRPDRDGFAVNDHAVEKSAEAVVSETVNRFAEAHELQESSVYSVLPREECTVRYMTLPSSEPDELDGMVRYAAEELVPLRPEEVFVSHRVLGTTDDGQARVIICVAPLARIRQHLDVLTAAGLHVEQILLSTDCLVEAVRETAGKTCLAVDASGTARADIVLLENGVPCLDKAWVSSSPNDSTAELAHDIRRFWSTSGQTHEAKPEVLLGGDAGLVAPLAKSLEASSFPIRANSEWALGGIQEGREHLKGSPLVLLGAALRICREGEGLPGLMPPEELDRRERRTRRKTLLWVSVAAACALITLGVSFGLAVQQRKGYIARLESEISALSPEARSVSAKRMQLNRLSQAVNREGNPLDALAVILEQSPESGLNLSHYRYDAQQGIEINGRAVDLPYVDTFLDNLSRRGAESLAAFAQASEVYRTERTERKQKVWDYEILVPFTPEPEEESL